MSTLDAFTAAEHERMHQWCAHAVSFDLLHTEYAFAKTRLSDFVRLAHEGKPRLVRVNSDRYKGLGWRTFIDYDRLSISVLLGHGQIRQYSARDVVIAEGPGTVVPAELRRAILRRSSISALDGRPRGTLP